VALRKGFPAKLSGSAADADDLRYNLAGAVVRDASGIPRDGLFPPTGGTLLTATGTWNVSVGAFFGVAVRDGGVVLLSNDGAANALVSGAPGANSRLDVFYAKQNDASGTVTTPDANNLPIFGVLAGIPSATPVRNPAGLPSGALELGTIRVPSTALATNSAGVVITPTFQYTAMAGGNILFRTAAERDAYAGSLSQRGTVFSDPTPANNGDFVSNGSVWSRPVYRTLLGAPGSVLAGAVPTVAAPILEQSGTFSVTTNVNGDSSFNFPAPFPNGLISVRLERFNFVSVAAVLTVGNATQTVGSYSWRTYSTSGAPLVSTTVSFAYHAIGW
jgi:hypothetical protein